MGEPLDPLASLGELGDTLESPGDAFNSCFPEDAESPIDGSRAHQVMDMVEHRCPGEDFGKAAVIASALHFDAGLDHLASSGRLLQHEAPLQIAVFALLRASLEAVARAHWLASPADDVVLLSRSLGSRRSDINESRALLGTRGQPEADARTQHLEKSASCIGTKIATMPGPTRLATAVGTAAGVNGRILYSHLSGAAHANTWMIQAGFETVGPGRIDGTVRQQPVVHGRLIALHFLNVLKVASVGGAAVVALHGGDTAPWERWCEERIAWITRGL